MDGTRFDALARSFGATRSRRGAIGLLAGAAGLAVVGADAKRRRKGKGTGPVAASAVCAGAGGKACALAQAKRGAVLRNCDDAGADLSGLALNSVSASKASFADADLSGATLSGANLSGACLSGADLTGATLRGANLGGADLTGADLGGADLRGSNVSRAQLAAAILGCRGTVLPDGSSTTCPGGRTCCASACVDLDADMGHRGACGTTCLLGQACCGGHCVDVQQDEGNCGACGHARQAGEFCCGTCCKSQCECGFWSDGRVQCTCRDWPGDRPAAPPAGRDPRGGAIRFRARGVDRGDRAAPQPPAANSLPTPSQAPDPAPKAGSRAFRGSAVCSVRWSSVAPGPKRQRRGRFVSPPPSSTALCARPARRA